MLYTNTENNLGDFLTIFKPVLSYLNNKIWDGCPTYIAQKEWHIGISIGEIKQIQSPTSEQNQQTG